MGLVVDSTGNDLTYRVIGAAMTVHNQLGPGFKEEVYEKALFVELQKLGIAAESQVPVEVYYREEQIAVFYLDLLVEDQVIVEVKALSHLLTNDEIAQVLNYLKAAEKSVGLLINFGRRKMEHKRIFPTKDMMESTRPGRDDALRTFRLVRRGEIGV